jgi:hypothetical protein
MKCGNCGAILDSHTCVTDRKAELCDGDVTICLYCGEVSRVENGKLVVVDVRMLPESTQDKIRILEDARWRTVKV